MNRHILHSQAIVLMPGMEQSAAKLVQVPHNFDVSGCFPKAQYYAGKSYGCLALA